MAQQDVFATVTVEENGQAKTIARIILNGRNIAEGTVFGRSGAMRSFKLMKGRLWDHWYTQTPVDVWDASGNYARARIYALPTSREGTGFIEFI